VLTLEQRGQAIPLARTRRPEVQRAVADAVLADLQAATSTERDEVMAAPLSQEVTRVRQTLCLLGLAPALAMEEDDA
jgi:hypothetical protein